MSRSALKIAMSLTAGIWFASSGFALGGIQRPGLVDSGKESSPFQPGQLAKAQGASDSRQRKINSFYSKLDRSILARFRPVERNGLIDFESAGAMLKSKTTVEKIFDKSFAHICYALCRT